MKQSILYLLTTTDNIMNVFTNKMGSQPYSSSFRVMLVIAIILFTIIAHNDAKFTWPFVIWALAALLAGPIFYKIIGLAVLISWGYIWSVVLIRHNLKRPWLLMGAFSILWIVTITQGYGLLKNMEMLSINYWFVISSVSFLVSSLVVLLKLRH